MGPVGVPPPGGTGSTVAVKVTLSPKTVVPSEVVTVVVVAVRTVWPSVSVSEL